MLSTDLPLEAESLVIFLYFHVEGAWGKPKPFRARNAVTLATDGDSSHRSPSFLSNLSSTAPSLSSPLFFLHSHILWPAH